MVKRVRDIKIATAVHGYAVWIVKKRGPARPVWRDKSSSASQSGEGVRLISRLSEALGERQRPEREGQDEVDAFHRFHVWIPFMEQLEISWAAGSFNGLPSDDKIG